jgi:hypothetical protein
MLEKKFPNHRWSKNSKCNNTELLLREREREREQALEKRKTQGKEKGSVLSVSSSVGSVVTTRIVFRPAPQ